MELGELPCASFLRTDKHHLPHGTAGQGGQEVAPGPAQGPEPCASPQADHSCVVWGGAGPRP